MLFHKFLTHDDAHNRSHHQASRPTAGVAQAVQALDAGVEVLVHLDSIGIEFELRRIEQGFGGSKAGNNLVYGVDKVDDIDHRPVRHSRRYVTRYRVGKRWLDVGARKLLLPRSLAFHNVAESLYENVSRAKHIG